MQLEGTKLFLLSLMDLSRNLITTVEKVTLGLLSNPDPVRRPVPKLSPLSRCRAAGAGDALTRSAPGHPGSPALSAGQGHRHFPGSLGGWRRFSPGAEMGAPGVAGGEVEMEPQDEKCDLFCVTLLSPPGCGLSGVGV